MNTSKIQKSALASAIAMALGASAVSQNSVADIALTFRDNTIPSTAPLPFSQGTSAGVVFPATKEFRVMTPSGTFTNDGFKDAIFGGETWTFDNAGELIGTSNVANAGNPGTCQVTSPPDCTAALTETVAGFPFCTSPSDPDCPVIEQGADFLGAGDFNFLAPVKGTLPGDVYGVATVSLDLGSTPKSISTLFPVTHAQWADGSYIIGADDPANTTHNDKFVKGQGPGVAIEDLDVSVTSAPGAADITIDFVLHGESRMTKDEVTVGGFNKQIVQWELPGTATINNQTPVAAADGPFSALAATPIQLDVLANDSDPDHALLKTTSFDTLAVNTVGACDNGGALTNNGSNVTYQSAALFAGLETCSYTVADGRTGVSAAAAITVNVGGGETPPTGNPDGAGGSIQTRQGQAISLDVLANDNDAPENDSFSVSRVDATSAEGGAVVIINGGAQFGNNVMYTPASGFNGADSFTYDVTDNDGTTSGVTVQIQVTPFAESSAGTVTLSQTVTAASIPVSDPDTSSSCQGGCFKVQVTGVPVGGQVEILLPKRTTGYQQSAVFRHFVESSQTWKDHEAPDAVQTAQADAVTGLCPGIGSGAWRAPTVGDTCTKYTLTDNGPNDDDSADGDLLDPVGFGQLIVDPVNQKSIISQGGCTLDSASNATWRNAGHWMLIGGFIAFMRLFRRKSS